MNRDRYYVRLHGAMFLIMDSQSGKQIDALITRPVADAICKKMNDEAAQSFSPNKEN